jgi:hypothetical protein
MTIIVAAGVSVAMLAVGFAMTYFVLPGIIVASLQKQQIMAEGAGPGEVVAPAAAHGEKPAAHAAPAAPAAAPAPAHGGAKPPPAEPPKEAGAHGGGEAKPPAKGAEGEVPAAGGEGGGGEGKAGGAAKPFELREMIVNTAGSRGNRFVKASLSFDGGPGVAAELETLRPKLTDMVLQTLGSKTVEELTAPTARGALRQELVNNTNAILQGGRVSNIYFLELIIQ